MAVAKSGVGIVAAAAVATNKSVVVVHQRNRRQVERQCVRQWEVLKFVASLNCQPTDCCLLRYVTDIGWVTQNSENVRANSWILAAS